MAKKRILLRKNETARVASWQTRASSLFVEKRQNLLYFATGIFVFFAILAGTSLYFKSYESNALKALTEANTLYNDETQKGESQDYNKIIAAFKIITTSYPRSKVSPFAHMFLGKIYYNNGEFSKALESYKVLIQDDLDDDLKILSQYSIGKAYESMGKLEDAFKNYEIISKKGGSLSVLVLKDIGRLLEKLNKTEDAKGKYKEFVEMNPDSPFRSEIMYRISQL